MKMKKWTKATLGALAALAVSAAPLSTYADSGGAVQVTFEGPMKNIASIDIVAGDELATLVPAQITLNGKVLANTYAVTNVQVSGTEAADNYEVVGYTPGEVMIPLNAVSAALNGQAGIQSYAVHENDLVGFGVGPNTTWTFNTLLYRQPLPMYEGGGYATTAGKSATFGASIAVNLNLLDEVTMFPIRDPSTGQTDQFVNVDHLLTLFKAMGFGATYDTTTNTLALTGPTPRPTYTKVTPQLYKEAVAQAQEAQAHHTTGMFGMLANNAQWYPDPKNVFFNRHFDVQHLKPGQVLQKWPWVVFLKGTGMGGSDVVAELVARGNNGTGFYGFYMIYELVDHNSGNVEWIAPNYWLAGNSDMQGAKPPLSRVPNIGTAPIYDRAGAWAYGYGLDVVPNLSWHTGTNPVNP
ncbi:hypothetical protein [Alicyclobacillus acidocaldarius]|uniref:Uncharacterized protein n=1 Tax=Alicyclobacillus acidocaldarius subsp. acidocaldarius (strain ATCC 27009 / DSM 446 / BCRC 14685 / JCM 5260 / KCTC 1825 / NBRC 15652 / NCIMB 11725 / NRRL B-14509 / 104-IA) TaxID=521098 RepID=C8WSV1_ALIAD|nr:hypothetical protein [Alicyclobacillus acidocaldarius]ACV57607.1 hypothetical protein Aaci_0558 [Alicyclobacillus acidocaldarius subsp. acidocaldarius DSM 446]